MNNSNKPVLCLVEGAKPIVVQSEQAPFAIDAMVFEEDTSLVLSADTAVRDPREHPIRLMTSLYDYQDQQPGRVVIREGRTTRMLAVVHDLDQEPTVREKWVLESLRAVFSACQKRKIKALGMEMLGCCHGKLDRDRFRSLLKTALERAATGFPARIWVKDIGD